MNYHNPTCSACGREYQKTEMRVEYFCQLGLTLCQNPAYQRGESEEPGCKDKIEEKVKGWASSQGQRNLEDFLVA